MSVITVLGAGGWGTALAVHLGHLNHDVRLWARDRELVDELRRTRANPSYLPGAVIPAAVTPEASLERALDRAEFVVSAVPSHGVRMVMREAAAFLPRRAIIVSTTKGLETETLQRMSELIAVEVGNLDRIAVLSGPSFASEVVRQLPTAVSVASINANVTEAVQREFRANYLRLYASPDVTGVEIGGALKNVTAIAAGVVEGLGLGHNALAALITRGLAETTRLACAVGGQRATLAGLSGLGDLVLTCTGHLSRNRHVGVELAKGKPLDEILAGMRMVAEGIRTTGAALSLGARHGVELPIAQQMADVLAGRKEPRAAVEDLMLRRQRAESEGE
jgi:glycerol-3-phosphate dehydrogenase (NAD(P)+)